MEKLGETSIAQIIKNKLSEIETRENIRILYACESGSRAWGISSVDSDYDVRFVFVRPMEDYLRVKNLPDYIDGELNEVYDINGWDLKKFFYQLLKSNPVIFEWANSPVVYKISSEWEAVKAIMNSYVLLDKMLHHYCGLSRRSGLLEICRNQNDKITQNVSSSNERYSFCNSDNEVSLKKYLYVMRSVLACDWIVKNKTVPPTEFIKLVDNLLPKDLRCLVEQLLVVKAKSLESDKIKRIIQLDIFIESKLNEAIIYCFNEKKENTCEIVDNLLYNIVKN